MKGYICASCGVRHTDGADDIDPATMICVPCGPAPKAPPPDMTVHTISLETQVVGLDATKAFDGLTLKERQYALALARADWEGAKICLLQTSPESTPIFCLLQLVFAPQSVAELISSARAKGLSKDETAKAMCWIAAFYGNVGNYKSFGDTKFVPDLPPPRLELLLLSGAADPAAVHTLWNECRERMYSLPPRQRQIGLGAANGISTYFSANCEEEDATIAGRFLDSIKLSAYNTRLFKSADGVYTVRIASATVASDGDDPVGQLCRHHDFDGKIFIVQRGDYAPLMTRVVAALEDAIPHVADDVQLRMVEKLIMAFDLGSIEEHMNASRIWVTDKGPAVESYIGFIESYRDPSGVRGEWEGFVACVNREVSKKFGVLVDGAEALLQLFPWPKVFEKDTFLRPDFTSLDVLAFGSSGVPAGINIPNYDAIRQSEGFKNVSLGNVLAASYGAGDKPITFVQKDDQAVFKACKSDAFEVQVGIHELLGHGSGKLIHQGTADAAALVDSKTLHPLTKVPITGPFYPVGTSWDSTFGKIASTYEECRAECSGLFLCLEQEVLDIFGHPTQPDAVGGISDIVYVNWLLMVRAGLTGLEFYTPQTKGWRQAHMQARYVILRVLLEAGGGLISLKQMTGADGEPDVEVCLDRCKVSTVGHTAIGAFLLALQTHKSLGDYAAGSTMYNQHAAVPEDMLNLRKIVMARKEPRKLMVQPHLAADADNTVALHVFDQSFVGMVESFAARFPGEDPELLALYHAEKTAVCD